ncbi:MAG: hypothetical protein NTY19_11245 [Planctomycetota bacterium]|nr:hypothetical protein [Planctomycetota bacterium]
MDNTAQLLRKAAILIDSLDGPTAEVLCAEISPEQAARIRQAVSQLGPVDPSERQRILDEFLRLGAATAGAAAAGVDLDESLAARIAVAVEVPDEVATDSSTAAPRFAFLQAASAESLASCFADEHPQTISVLLAHLPAPRAARVLKLLRTELQAEVVQRLARLDDTDADILAEIERTLEQSWQTHACASSSRPAGMATLEAILAASANGDRPALLELLESTDPQLVRKLGYPQPPASPRTAGDIRTDWDQQDLDSCRRSTTAFRFAVSVDLPETGLDLEVDPLPQIVAWTASTSTAADPSAAGSPPEALDFDDLLALDDGALASIFRAADPHVALLALTGASPQMADRMLGQLPPREATGLARQMETLGPIRLQDVACAQQQLADLAWQLVKQGSIRLPKARYFTEAV